MMWKSSSDDAGDEGGSDYHCVLWLMVVSARASRLESVMLDVLRWTRHLAAAAFSLGPSCPPSRCFNHGGGYSFVGSRTKYESSMTSVAGSIYAMSLTSHSSCDQRSKTVLDPGVVGVQLADLAVKRVEERDGPDADRDSKLETARVSEKGLALPHGRSLLLKMVQPLPV